MVSEFYFTISQSQKHILVNINSYFTISSYQVKIVKILYNRFSKDVVLLEVKNQEKYIDDANFSMTILQ